MPPLIGRRAFVAATASALAMPAIARAQTVRTMKMTLADTVASPVFAISQRFAANLKEKSGGTLDVQVYGAGQLGSQTNAMTSLQTGIVDFVASTTGLMETVFPRVSVLDLPYLFRDPETADRVLDGAVGDELFKAFPDKGIYGLCWGWWGWRPVSTHTPEPINEPKDMAGVKIRIQPGAIYAETYKLLGAIPVAIDISEAYLAMSQGAVQAVELPYISMVANKFQEVVKHTNGTNVNYNPGALMVAKRRFDTFTPEQQAAVRAAAKDMSADWRKSVATATDQAAATMKAAGVTFSDANVPAFVAATKPIYEKFRPVIGADLVDLAMKQAGA